MTDNEKIEKLVHWSGDYDKLSFGDSFPDYLNDDAAAMSLLDTLVEKDYMVELNCDKDGAMVTIRKWDQGIKRIAFPCALMDTRREAIIAACLEVARKEMDI